ncbi:alpha-mannosidase-like [Camellia sinensis]|uniref:alpha-mannosidase-like n=1 Tax=Camellia sinensis TaxID=4442 RepID=UPI00103599EB|nr:alpha-mannosidase-like [Camellia sinensis]XP_028107659.1 alpha-mannosidase-like [Camellia sinensis]
MTALTYQRIKNHRCSPSQMTTAAYLPPSHIITSPLPLTIVLPPIDIQVRDYIEDWPLQVQPVAGNYDPLNLGIYTVDNKSEFSILVDCAVGGAGIEDGEVELMLHRTYNL